MSINVYHTINLILYRLKSIERLYKSVDSNHNNTFTHTDTIVATWVLDQVLNIN